MKSRIKPVSRHFISIFILSLLVDVFIVWMVIQNYIAASIVLFLSIFTLSILLLRHYLRLQSILDESLSRIENSCMQTDASSKNTDQKAVQETTKILHSSTNQFEIQLMGALAYIENSHEALKELERLNSCKSSTLDTILAVSQHITHRENDINFYNIILESAIKVINKASKGSLLLLNAQTNQYEYQAAIGFDLNILKNISYKRDQTLLFQNAHGDLVNALVTSSVKDYDNSVLSEEALEWLKQADGFDTKETLSVPIIIDGIVYAILNIDSSEENAFTDVDIHLIQFFSAQISVALKNKMLMEETIKLSKFDNLTGAYNRDYFEKIFANHSELTLENLEPFALVLCDLNFLKLINDTFGHTAGDLVLTEFSSMMQSSIRDSDVFSRVGGDEFVILLKNISASVAIQKMDSIFKTYEYHKINFNGHKLPVSFSYGLATSPDDSMVYDVLVKIADIRMYEFKKSYKETHLDILDNISQTG